MSAKQYVNLDGLTVYDEEMKDYIEEQGYVSGSGTNGSLAKFDGTGSITDAAALGNDTTKFLRNDGEWAVPPGTGGVPSIGDIGDVSITSATDGQVLKYNSTNSEWENGSLDLSTLEKKGVECTQAQYDAWDAQGLIDPLVDYHIKDGSVGHLEINDGTKAYDSTWSSMKISDVAGLKVKQWKSSTYTANGSNTFRYYLQQMHLELTNAISNLADGEYIIVDSVYMSIQLRQSRFHLYPNSQTPATLAFSGMYENTAGTQSGYNCVVMSSTLSECTRCYVTFTFSNNSVSCGDASTGVPANGTAMYLNYYILYS